MQAGTRSIATNKVQGKALENTTINGHGRGFWFTRESSIFSVHPVVLLCTHFDATFHAHHAHFILDILVQSNQVDVVRHFDDAGADYQRFFDPSVVASHR
jgi:hypothetical protein